jgi:hypothetical protein
MADGPSLVRFFRVVNPLPLLMTETFGVVFIVASAVVLLDAARTPDVLMPVLVLQLFAASSGFAGPARRGYYDLLLTRGDSRLSIAVAHWAFSIAPGIATVLGIAAIEAASRRAFPVVTLASGTLAAMAVVSTLPWAFTVGLPRFSGAIGWLVTLAMATTFWSPDQTFAAGAAPSAAMAMAVLVHPGLLVGRSLPADGVAAVPALALAAVALVAACLWIVRADYPLEAAQ